MWTNPRGGGTEQLFTVIAAWGYPVGAMRGRPKVKSLVEASQILLDGSRVYSLRKHPVPARSDG